VPATRLATLASADPHAELARLRAREAVSYVAELGGWLVTRRDVALAVMRDAERFTVDDPRFTTARVVGPSMLSLEGDEHHRHRAPFAAPFRKGPVLDRFTPLVEAEASRLVEAFATGGRTELRASFAGPLAAAVVCQALGLGDRTATADVLGWYGSIVGAVQELTAGASDTPPDGLNAFAALRAAIAPVLDEGDEDAGSLLAAAVHGSATLAHDEAASNAAVLLFGGIETTEGMILNTVLHLLSRPEQLARVEGDPALVAAAVEESLRFEPAAAMVDRYATRDTTLEGASIRQGDLVVVSITAANRDPAAFADPDRFDLARADAKTHVAWGAGPHVCIGMHLARLEVQTAIRVLLARLPGLGLDPGEPAPAASGLVFRKPPALRVRWEPAASFLPR
jgi:cytochrome P450